MLLATLGFITPMLAIVVMIVSIFSILINTLRIRTLKLESIISETVDTVAETSFNVSNMVCEGCAEKITDILKAVEGVEKVKTKVMDKLVKVEFNPQQTNEENLEAALKKSGYTTLKN